MQTVYIVECRDKTLYTGTAVDVSKRVLEHNEGKRGAKYTRARRPVVLVYTETCETLSRARSREAEIKRMSREMKRVLIASGSI